MDAFFVKSEDSGSEEVHSMFDYMHFESVWLDSLDHPDKIPSSFPFSGPCSFG